MGIPKYLKGLLYSICVILFFAYSSYCQDSPLLLKKIPEEILLDDYISVLQNKDEKLDINKALEASPNLWVNIKSLPNRFEAQNGWFKLSFNTKILADGLIIYLPLISKAEAYIVQGNKIKGEFKGGEFENANKKVVLSSRTSFVIPIHNIEKGNFEVYIKAKDLKNTPIEFNWQLRHYSDWMWEYYYLSIKDVLFLAINLVLFISAVLLFVFLKRKAYLYYAGYIIATSIYFAWDTGYTANYLFGNFQNFNFALKITQNIAPIFYVLFLSSFNYKYRNTLNKIFRGAIFINAVFILIVVSWIFFGDNYELMLAHLANAISGLTMLLVSIIFLINFKLRKIQHYLACAGVSIVALSYLTTIALFYIGIGNFKIYFQIGFLVEIFMFTLGIIFQFRQNEINKIATQNSLIKELRKNKLLQDNYNVELERKVNERTKEITQKNEEILKQRNELLENSNALKELNTELVAQTETIYKANERHFKNLKILKKAYVRLKSVQQELNLKNEAIEKINKNQEKIIASRNRGLLKAKAELDEFLYRTSHNLKGPVARIKGLQELLKIELRNNDNTKEYLERLERVIEKMEDLFQKLNFVSIINKANNREKLFDISKAIASVISERRNEISSADALVVEDTMPLMMEVNPKIIKIIIELLLQNSLQFKDNERALKIEIHLSTQDNFVKLAVKDNGSGIIPKNISKVFDMFYIGTLDSEGDGLGLYIVKKAVDSLNGFINIESEYQKGTTVNITFPIATKDANRSTSKKVNSTL